MTCKYWDCGFCYAPADAKNNSIQGGCFEPEYCATYLMQNKPMMTEKEHLECEIKELELEIKKHNEAIQNLNNIKERKQQQLNKFPITLERIVVECDEDTIIVSGVKYRRVVEEPKPPTLYEALQPPYSSVAYMFNEGQKEWICNIVRGWLIDHTVIETEDAEMVTFTIHKEQLQTPNETIQH